MQHVNHEPGIGGHANSGQSDSQRIGLMDVVQTTSREEGCGGREHSLHFRAAGGRLRAVAVIRRSLAYPRKKAPAAPHSRCSAVFPGKLAALWLPLLRFPTHALGPSTNMHVCGEMHPNTPHARPFPPAIFSPCHGRFFFLTFTR